MYALYIAAVLAVSGPGTPAPEPQQADAARRIVATLQLAAQEYRLAFAGGRLVNTAEAEEAALFIATARGAVRQLEPGVAARIEGTVAAMAALVARSGPADSLAYAAGTVERQLEQALGVAMDERPTRAPSLTAGQRIFEQRCASCHGASGAGDGVAAAGLTPRPADLRDTALMASATPLDLYRKITTGVPATGMAPYETVLDRDERWDVTAYILRFTDPAAREDGRLALVFGAVRGTLRGALDLARRGPAERAAAAARVLDAYMEFEAVEPELAATEPAIVTRAERGFAELRAAAQSGDTAQLGVAHAALLGTLAEAQRALLRSHSSGGLFAKSLLLILREGFEAILVIGAIMAVLARAGAQQRRRNVRWGIAAALAASLVTAALLEGVLRVTPAQREALEGGIMLAAAATLFYVSYWLVSKIEVAAWQRFVKTRIEQAVARGSGVALAGAAFLAVYREGFETVLFYKALFLAGGAAGGSPVLAGLVVGLVALAAVYVAIEKFGVRIPLRPFFAVTSATLLYMAFTFAGAGVKELQEGGLLPATPLAWAPRSDFFSIYPTVETLAVQAVILLAVSVALVWTFVVRPRRVAATVPLEGPREAAAPRTTQPRRLRTPAGV